MSAGRAGSASERVETEVCAVGVVSTRLVPLMSAGRAGSASERVETEESTDSQIGLGSGPDLAEHRVMAWTYILRCNDGSYYVGSTRSLEVRLFEHQEGRGAVYTSRRLPVELMWSHEFETVAEAFGFEKQVQNWSRAKREALIEGRLADLPALAWGYRYGVRRE
jgi:putative endonuclease